MFNIFKKLFKRKTNYHNKVTVEINFNSDQKIVINNKEIDPRSELGIEILKKMNKYSEVADGRFKDFEEVIDEIDDMIKKVGKNGK